MKIKNIAAICKKNKYAVIYERYTEGGGVVQYIGDGAAAYPVTGLPALDKEYFVYCPICGIETAETYTSKAKALKAFADGKTKPISGKEAGGGE